MDALSPQFTLLLTVTGVAAIAIGWAIGTVQARRSLRILRDEWQVKLDNFVRERDRLTSETVHLRNVIEQQQGVVHRGEVALSRARTELESLRERNKQLNRDLFTLKTEREDFKTRVREIQDQMSMLKHHSVELQSEFIKSREFYKAELTKSFERRKDLEQKLEMSRAEQSSFANLLESSQTEHESVNRMLASAQNRLRQMDMLEQDVIRLEADNAQLNHDYTLARQEIDNLKRDVAELDELKIQNKELAEVLKSMENSRRQYESDAKRYRETAEIAEKKSDTLRLRLDDVEQNFLEMEKQQRKALEEARKPQAANAANAANDSNKAAARDDLQEIIGIGKVFERALNDLGIYTFAQIANFDISDIARVNATLKGSEGRMEADDWIGQARELHFKKYGDSNAA